jgi:hypothetical protein
MVQKEDELLIYEVEYLDVTTSATKTESIRFQSFIEDIKKRARIYSGILARTGSGYKRLEEAGEEQLFMFLHKHIEELQLIHRRLTGLDTFFRSELRSNLPLCNTPSYRQTRKNTIMLQRKKRWNNSGNWE